MFYKGWLPAAISALLLLLRLITFESSEPDQTKTVGSDFDFKLDDHGAGATMLQTLHLKTRLHRGYLETRARSYHTKQTLLNVRDRCIFKEAWAERGGDMPAG